MTAPENWWESTSGSELRQGDYLRGCIVPKMPSDFRPPTGGESVTFKAAPVDLIIVTQSCDLENAKVALAAGCPVFRVDDYDRMQGKKGPWESVKKGREPALHLLSSCEDPTDAASARVVDFREIISLPVGYLGMHANALGNRPRLKSPYLEHFSQAFARFFMRVGLPGALPSFK